MMKKISTYLQLKEGQKDWSVWLLPIAALPFVLAGLYDIIGHDLRWF